MPPTSPPLLAEAPVAYGVDAIPAAAVEKARLVRDWYLDRYHGQPDDLGLVWMFTDPARVGAFAVEQAALEADEPAALFRVLVATTLFQRRQDQQILRVLRGIGPADMAELTDAAGLRAAAAGCGCPRAADLARLIGDCDLHKDSAGQGACTVAPEVACLPKRHAVLLKRYGHFGKVPTSLALAVEAAGAPDLADLRRRCIAEAAGPAEAAERLEAALCTAWRVSDKIAAMFLSMLSNPDLWPGGRAPWQEGLDWRRWVVIDSNTDLFLAWLGYRGPGTYAARRRFLGELAARVDRLGLRPGLHPNNPRLLQQAGYLFMSRTNRRALHRDCAKEPGACGRCPETLAAGCPMRRTAGYTVGAAGARRRSRARLASAPESVKPPSTDSSPLPQPAETMAS